MLGGESEGNVIPAARAKMNTIVRHSWEGYCREYSSILDREKTRARMTDYIGYEALQHAAMRGVMREALKTVVENGSPPGDHHFYISFRTRAPGVNIADYLIERFPQDMTIVIQHQYWDLEVTEDRFEIILKFSGVPQHLSVPFTAVTRFVDPSVNYGLSFEDEPANGDVAVLNPVEEPADQLTGDSSEDPDDSETVVSLDAFRRK